ncbi:hypothetical protein RCJ22_07735, partial [Vibrio sp. FNV 38]|nr:hypothetical protein [Vibrio sp. FNV 38]
SPPNSGGGGELPPPELPDVADVVVATSEELIAEIETADTGAVIGLDQNVIFDGLGSLTIDKAITLVSTDSDGNLPDSSTRSTSLQAVISGDSCIYIPSSADETLRNGNQVTISNITFQDINMIACSSDGNDTQNAIINVGKVGKDKTYVNFDNLVFNGDTFAETSGSSDAWIYSRGLINITNGALLNKNDSAMNMVYLNCGSSASRGGSNTDPVGSKFSDSEFSMAELSTSSPTKAFTVGVPSNLGQDDKNCLITVKDNTFNNFTALISETDDLSTAIYDVFNDTNEANNTLNGEGGTDPDPGDGDVDSLNAAIDNASVGETIYLDADGDYSEGVIELSKAVILDGDNSAVISGNACITVTAPGAEIRNLTFENDYLGFDGSDQNNTCALGTSDGQSGAISIDKIGKDDAPVVLDNLIFNAENTVDQGSFGAKKASWVFSYGHFHLTNSEFKNLASNVQNNGVHINCSSDNARFGSVIEANTFTINDAGSSETAAIKIGDSSGSQIKAGNNEECNVTINDNIFDGYKTLLTADLNNDSGDERPAGIFAHASALNSDADETNSIQ